MGPTIAVTGSGGPAGRALLELLAGRGTPVIGVDMAPCPSPGIVVEAVPAAHDRAFVRALLDVARRHDVGLIVPTVSEELPVLAARASSIADVRILVGCRYGVAVADDKWCTAKVLAEAGVPVPRSALPSMLPAGARTAVLGTPFLSKPRRGRGGRDVHVHPQDATGRDAFDDRHLLQEFVPGAEYVADLYLAGADRRDADVAVVLRKVALAEGTTGNATAVVRADAEADIAALGLAAARALGLTGPVDVDIRRRGDGTPVVLEVNARFGAHVAWAPELVEALLTMYRAGASA